MLRQKIGVIVLIVALALTSMGLAGCRKQDTATPTPAAQATPKQQSLPSVGSDVSPLATPAGALSPVKP